jgi:hypothetical protein
METKSDYKMAEPKELLLDYWKETSKVAPKEMRKDAP